MAQECFHSIPLTQTVRTFLLLACLLVLHAGPGAEAEEPVCAQASSILCDDFESGNLSLWQDGFDQALHRINTQSVNVYGGQKSLEVTYPAGADGGWLTRWFMPGFDHAFARLYVKFEPGWRCGQNCTKLLGFYGNRLDDQWSGFGKAGIKPTGTDFFFASLVTLNWTYSDPGEIIFYSYFPEMQQAPDGMYWGNFFYQTNPRIGLQATQWYCLELEVQANTPGQHDGFQKMWIDGVFKGQVLNMRWRDTTDLRINAFQLTFPGIVPITEHLWIDNVVVSTQQIGCTGGQQDTTPPAAPTNLRVN